MLSKEIRESLRVREFECDWCFPGQIGINYVI